MQFYDFLIILAPMKALMVLLVIAAAFCALFFGYIYLTSKAMSTNPTPDVSQTTMGWQTQSEKARDIRDQQRELMRQRQDRMRDLQRR